MRLPPLILLAMLCCLLAGLPATAEAGVGKRTAERLVHKRLAAGLPEQRKVTCRRAKSGWTCAWRAASRPSRGWRRSCRGQDRVAGRKPRARQSRVRCARVAVVPRSSAPPKAAPTRTGTSPGKSPAPLNAVAGKPSGPPSTGSGTLTDTQRNVLFGFNDNAVRAGLISARDDAILTERVGATVHRLTMDWRWLEPTPGRFNWQAYDDIYREMTARGIRPLFILMFAPTWAQAPESACNQWAQDCRQPPGTAHDADWRRLAATVAKRYPLAAGIEIWNEPNETTFWQTGPDPGRYAQLLRSAHDAIKEVAPTMKVIGGGPSNRQYAEGSSLTQSAFLRGMYAAGAAGHMDALGVHPYPWSLASTLQRDSLAQARAQRNAAGDRDVPLWITETGLSTGGWDARYAFSFGQQSDGLAGIYRDLASEPDVDAVMFHTLISPPAGAGDREAGYAVLNSDRSPKPAYCALGAARGRKAC